MHLKFWEPKPKTRLEIYMKSGNVIEIDGVTDWKTRTNLNEGMEYLMITQSSYAKYKLIVTTIDLKQIEAIVLL